MILFDNMLIGFIIGWLLLEIITKIIKNIGEMI